MCNPKKILCDFFVFFWSFLFSVLYLLSIVGKIVIQLLLPYPPNNGIRAKGFVRDLVCGGNHLYFSVFPPSAYAVFPRTRRTKVISSTCLCSNSFFEQFLGKIYLRKNLYSKPRNIEVFFFAYSLDVRL